MPLVLYVLLAVMGNGQGGRLLIYRTVTLKVNLGSLKRKKQLICP